MSKTENSLKNPPLKFDQHPPLIVVVVDVTVLLCHGVVHARNVNGYQSRIMSVVQGEKPRYQDGDIEQEAGIT